ncbi:MAG: hypothetical protein IKJ35_05530 [Clostridia bacterium]|nr:hypothetical protein [Clostridia bacterium]
MRKQPAKVNYFFGGAYRTLIKTILGSFAKTFGLITVLAPLPFKAFFLFIKAFVALVVSIFSLDFRDIWDNTKDTVFALWSFTYTLPTFLSVLILTPTMCLILSAIQLVIFLGLMFTIYVVYTITYLLDLLFRKIKQISNTCRYCQRKIKNPIYFCPNCGVEHDMLIPSKYGVFKRRCECGAKLGTTFLSGREKLESKCPYCESGIADTSHVDITVPVVGGPSAGKTCFIHMAISDIEQNSMTDHKLEYEYDPGIDDEFAMNMSNLKQGLAPNKTSDMRLRFYSFYLKPKKGIKHLISLCDVGGEIYDDSESLGTQAALTHSNAFLMVIDPLSMMDYRKELEQNGVDISKFGPSSKPIDEVLSLLITTLENMCNISAKDMLNRDLAVVFSKGDLPGLEEKIGKTAVEEYMTSHAGTTRLQAQNAVCEQFLKEYDEFGFLNAVKSKFKVVQFFASSALGHAADGSAFESNGVSEPVYWIVDKISASIDLTEVWDEKRG